MGIKKLIESVKTHTVQSGMCDDVTYVEKSEAIDVNTLTETTAFNF